MSSVKGQAQDGFWSFYGEVFSNEHRSPPNIALHIAGVLLSAALIPFAIWNGNLWLVLLYPIVHAAPGLIGHRLFERNEAVGDVRLTRKDHPLL